MTVTPRSVPALFCALVLVPEVRMAASMIWPVRLPAACVTKLEELAATVGKSRAQVMRALILAATPELLPKAWRDVDPDERQLIGIAEHLDRGVE